MKTELIHDFFISVRSLWRRMDHVTALMTGPEFRYRLKQASVGLIQVGGFRDHGPHISSGAEWALLDEYVTRAVQRLHPYILREQPIVQSVGERAILGSSPETLKASIGDLLTKTAELGVPRAVVLSASAQEHEVAQTAVEGAKLKAKVLALFEMYPKVQQLEGEETKGTGNAYLTAQLMHIRPEMVKPDMMQYANASFGVSGDPKRATPEVGKLIFDQTFEALVAALDSFMRE